jgi:hypothetical protein
VAAVFIAAIGTVVALWGLQRGEFKALRGEIRGEINELRLEMRADNRALSDKIDRVLLELLHHVQHGHPHGPPNQAA